MTIASFGVRSLRTWSAWVCLSMVVGTAGCDEVDRDAPPSTEPAPVAAEIDVDGAESPTRLAFVEQGGERVAVHGELSMVVRATGVAALQAGSSPRIELETASVSRGEVVLPSDVASVTSEAARVAVDRGVATEHFEATPQGLAQSWDFASEPGKSGDLEIAVAFWGYAYEGESRLGHRLVHPDTGHAMIYGAATWIDADGDRTSVAVEHEAGQLVVVVPEALVESSSYPAVLDPVIGPEVVANDGREEAPGDQREPRIASDGDGRQLIVWSDTRAGDTDVRGAFHHSGQGVVTPDGFVLAGGVGSQGDPSVAYDGADYMLAWQDSAGSGDIRVARVSDTGFAAPAGGVLVAGGAATQATPSIACEPGRCLVVWIELSPGIGPRLRARFYSVTGGLEATTFTLTPATTGHFSPEVAYADGRYAVAWSDHTSGRSIRAMRVDPAGLVLDPGGVLLSTGDWNYTPRVDAKGGDAVVTWKQFDGPGGPQKIMARGVSLLDGAASPGPHTLGPDTSVGSVADVAFDGSRFVVCAGANADFPCRQVDETGAPITASPVNVGDPAIPPVFRVSLAFDGTDTVLTWDHGVSFSTEIDVYALRIDASLTRLGDDMLVSSAPADAQNAPALAWSGKSYLVVWQDRRFGTWDILGARVDRSGRVLDEEPIVISSAPSDQIEPAVAYASSHLVVWADNRNGNFDIYGTRVDPYGGVTDPGGIPISTAPKHQRRPKVAYNGGNFLVAYSDTRHGNSDVYATRVGGGVVLDPSGIPICTLTSAQGAVDVARGDLWSYVVFEHALNANTIQLRGTAVSPAGVVHTPNGRSLAISDNVQEEPAVASNGDDEFVVVWEGVGRIRGSTFDFAGNYITGGNIGAAGYTGHEPDISFDGEQYMVVWRDTATGDDVRGAYIDHAFTITDPEFVLSGGPNQQAAPAVEAAATGLGLAAFQVDTGASVRVRTRTLGNGCCDPTGTTPGCLDFDVQSCVCDADPYCCSTDWDGLCVAQADGCGTTCSCCAASSAGGCVDADVEECVCAWDPYCCEVQWDGICVSEITQHACGSC